MAKAELVKKTKELNAIRHKHFWILLADDVGKSFPRHKGAWYWCCECGATKHIVFDCKYFGIEKNGVYIRKPGEKAYMLWGKK